MFDFVLEFGFGGNDAGPQTRRLRQKALISSWLGHIFIKTNLSPHILVFFFFCLTLLLIYMGFGLFLWLHKEDLRLLTQSLLTSVSVDICFFLNHSTFHLHPLVSLFTCCLNLFVCWSDYLTWWESFVRSPTVSLKLWLQYSTELDISILSTILLVARHRCTRHFCWSLVWVCTQVSYSQGRGVRPGV